MPNRRAICSIGWIPVIYVCKSLCSRWCVQVRSTCSHCRYTVLRTPYQSRIEFEWNVVACWCGGLMSNIQSSSDNFVSDSDKFKMCRFLPLLRRLSHSIECADSEWLFLIQTHRLHANSQHKWTDDNPPDVHPRSPSPCTHLHKMNGKGGTRWAETHSKLPNIHKNTNESSSVVRNRNGKSHKNAF